MNSLNLISKISSRLNLSKKICESIFERIFDGIKNRLKESGEFDIENFGNFKVVRRKIQKAIDYNKKAVVLLPPKDKMIFTYYDGMGELDNQEKYNKKEIFAKDLIKDIASELKLDEIEVYNYYYILFDLVKECFKKQINVNILEFGKFKISGKGKISFSPAKKFQDEINYNFNNLETVIVRMLTPLELEKMKKLPREEFEKPIIEKKEQIKEDTYVNDTQEEELITKEDIEEKEIIEEKITEEIEEEKDIKTEVEEILKKFNEEKLRLKEEIDELKKRVASLEVIEKEAPKTLPPEILPKKEELKPPEEILEIEKEVEEEKAKEVKKFAETEKEIPQEEIKEAEELVDIEKEIPQEEIKEVEELTAIEREIPQEKEEIATVEEHLEEDKTEQPGLIEEIEKEIKEELKQAEEPKESEIVKEKKEESWEESFERKWRELREKIFSTSPTDIEELSSPTIKGPSEEIYSEQLTESVPDIETEQVYKVEIEEEKPKTEEPLIRADKTLVDLTSEETVESEENKDITPAYPEVIEDDDELSISEIYGRLKESFSYIASEHRQIEEKEEDIESKEKSYSEEDIQGTYIKSQEPQIREPEKIEKEPTEVVDTSMEDVIKKYEKLREKLREELEREEGAYPDEDISEKPVVPVYSSPKEIAEISINELDTEVQLKPSKDISNAKIEEETAKTENHETKLIFSISDLESKKVDEQLTESIDKTLQEIKQYMDEIAKKENLPLSNNENSIQKETPFKTINEIELPKSIDDYFEQISKDNIKKFPDINGDNNNEHNNETEDSEKE